MQNNESSNIRIIIVDKYKYLNYNMSVNKRWQQNSSSAMFIAEIKLSITVYKNFMKGG